MKGLLIAGLVTASVMPAATMAQDSFNGTWKLDVSSAFPKNVNVWLLKDGLYRCTSCSPSIEVKADGKDQPVKGQPYDTISAKVVSPRTVEEVEKKNGQVVSDETFTVSDDGRTATDAFGNWKVIMTRVAEAPAGAHELSGSWKPLKIESISDRELLVTYKLEGNTLSMSCAAGQSYVARFDGLDAAYTGDPDMNAVALKRISRNVIEETDKLNGKVVSVTRLTLAADGKSITVSVKHARDGSTNEFIMRKP